MTSYVDMKAIKLLMTTAMALLVFSSATMAGGGWMTNVDDALAKGKKDKKPVLVEFTGSDWCPPCIMMQKKVFSKKEFIKKASEKFILVKIDIPQKDPKLSEKNQKVVNKYRVGGFPTIILFDNDGREFNRFIASEFPSVSRFLAYLDRALERKDMD